MTGDEGAALDTSVDMSDPGDTGAEPSEGLDSTPSNDSGGETAAEKRERLKLKWLGREEEIDDPAKLAERFSDDYEYEFRGPGGKPLKAKWPDIERHVQLSAGAKAAMQRAKEQEQAMRQQIERGRANNHENLLDVIEEVYGVEDSTAWLELQYMKHYEQEAQMANLAAQLAADPHNEALKWQYNRALMQRAQSKQQRKEQWQRQQQQQAEMRRQQEAEGQRYDQELRGSLKASGVPVNEHTVARAYWLKRQHQQEMGGDVPLEPRQIAAQLRRELDKEVHGHLTSLPPEKLLPFLGDKLRAALREAELAATKAAKKAQSAGSAPASNGNGAKREPTDSAFDKAIRNMMRGS